MKTRIKPMRQGACDRLCGAYAVLNAVAALSPTLTVTEKNNLFRTMLHSISTKRQLSIDHLWAGLDSEDIETLLDVAANFLKPRFEYLVHRRFRRGRSASVADILSRLREDLDEGSVAILRVELIDTKHWTVAYKVSKRRIRLIDSAGMDDLPRKRCGIGRLSFTPRLLPASFRIVRLQSEEPEPPKEAPQRDADKSQS